MNIDGLQYVMDIHKQTVTPCTRFYYLSTVYVAGKTINYVPETRIPVNEDMRFTNEYEQS